MNSEHDAHLDAWMEPEAPQGQGQGANPLLLVHRALRGRYLLAIALGFVLAVPCALVGYKILPPVYTSSGVVTIDPTRPVILYENEANEAITGFESFVRSQARTLESPRVMQAAAQQLVADGVMQPGTTNWVELQKSTSVGVPRGGRDMIVSVTKQDPRVAQRSAQAILNAYAAIAIDEESETWQGRLDQLDIVIRNAANELAFAQEEARRMAEAEGTADLERRRLFVQEQVEALDAQIQAIEIELPTFQEEQAGTDGEAEKPKRELTLEDFAQIDPDLSALMNQRRQIEQRMGVLLARVTERHPDYLNATDELAFVQDRIDERFAQLEEMGLEDVADGAGFAGLRQRLAAMRRIREARAAEAKRLSAIAAQIREQEEAISSARQTIELATRRKEGLETERSNATEGRVRISQEAEFPFGPSKDRRRPLAAMGAMGGFGLSIAAFAAYGIFRPRYNFVADLEDETASPPVLGLVPLVAEGRIEGDEAAQAGIHQIRSLIESAPRKRKCRVIVVTSAAAAEGKSTLGAALSASMARSGRRTLLIDGDLVGRGVTARLSARSLVGLSDLIADPQAKSQSGIHSVEGRANLDLMPAGIAAGFEPDQLSSQAMQELIASLRERYDAIIVDTGPILGSLEANAVVPHADQVVLVVSRGQDARLVKVAIDRLRRFNAEQIGLVFNRANHADIERSTSAASVSLRSRAASRPASNQAAPMSASA